MKSIQVQLTTECNERCFMCRKYTWKKREIDIDVLKEKIEKYKECTFTFSGGDPLSYRKIKELNDILEKNKIKYQIFTNMNYVLSSEQKRFIENAQTVQVSLDGSNEKVYNRVRRCRENGFKTVIYNLGYYKDKVKVNCTVSNRNYFDVKNIYNFCKMVGLTVRFFPVHTDESAKLEKWMIEDILKNFEMNGEIPEEIKVFKNISEREAFKGKCFVKKEHRLIDENGVEYPCCRAINDNGLEWGEKNSIENLEHLDDENVIYDFCSGCDRYRKFNENWCLYENRKELFL